jgi:hypothetical protein
MNLWEETKVEEEKLIRAAQDFLRLNRDYADTQINFDLMRAVIEREKLDPSSVSDLNTAWSRIKVITRNDAPIDQTPATVRPRQTTVIPVPVAPALEPPIDEAQAALDAAAKELVASYGGDSGFKTFFNNLSAKQMEAELRDFRFQRAVEICFPQTETSLLTRGDYVRGVQVVRAAEISGSDPYAAERAIAKSRDLHAQAYANYQERAPGPEGGKPHWGPSFANRRTVQTGPRNMTASEARANELANAARSGQPEKSRADAIREAQLEEAKVKAERWSR